MSAEPLVLRACCTSRLGRAALLALACAATGAQAADPCDPSAGGPGAYRFLEDCSALAALPAESPQRRGLQALRYRSLDGSAHRFVTFGGELRLRWEQLDPQRFGIGGGTRFSATQERLSAHADLHLERFRAFVQLNVSSEHGWPLARPADHSAVDLTQGFVQWNALDRAGSEGSFVRIGRQELALAPNRLVGVNEATNIRRAFDGLLAQVAAWGTTATAFMTRPVANRPGAFDDRGDARERFDGLDWQLPTTLRFEPIAFSVRSLDVFDFRRQRDHAAFQNAVGRERKDTAGVRAEGAIATLDYAVQFDRQRGSVGDRRVAARAATVDLTRRLAGIPWNPSLTATLGWAEGDRNPASGTLTTFDTLYPNLSYGTDAGYFFPGNSRDASAAITLHPDEASTVQAGFYRYGRVSTWDAVYQPPGLVLVRGSGTGDRRVANLPFLRVAYRVDRYSEWSMAAVRLVAGPVLIAAGGRSATYGLVQWQFRF